MRYEGAAADRYGLDTVLSASTFSADFVREFGVNQEVERLRPEAVGASAAEDVLSHLTNDAKRAFITVLNASEPTTGYSGVSGQSVVSLAEPRAQGYTLRSDVPAVSDVRVTNLTVDLADDRLSVAQDYSATLRYRRTSDGKRFQMKIRKSVTLYVDHLVIGDKWLIDGWTEEARGAAISPER